MTENEMKKADDLIKCIYEGACASLLNTNTLTYEVGENKLAGTLHLRVSRNTGGGTFSDGWICGRSIDDAVSCNFQLTGKILNELLNIKNQNTGGFILAALMDLGLLRKINSRLYEHLSQTTFMSVVMRRLQEKEE